MARRRTSKRPKWGKLPPGVQVRWLPVNQAWAVTWHAEVLRIFPRGAEDDVRDYLQYIRPQSPPLALQAESAAAKGERKIRSRAAARQVVLTGISEGGTIRGRKRAMDIMQRQTARAVYRDTVRNTRAADKKTKAERNKDLKCASGKCKAERKKANQDVSKKCKSRRDKIRGKANAALDKSKAKRAEKRRSWLWYAGSVTSLIPPGGRKYSRAESDDLARADLEARRPELAGLWDKHKRQITYDLQPDYRAERFIEWVRETPEALAEYQLEQERIGEKALAKAERKAFEDRYGEGSWARAERGERGEWSENGAEAEQDYDDVIPF
jgi:hypothetical protein